MLILNRKVGERILIGDSITVSVQRVAGNRVSLAIEAPGDVRIMRFELEGSDTSVPAAVSKALTAGLARQVGPCSRVA